MNRRTDAPPLYEYKFLLESHAVARVLRIVDALYRGTDPFPEGWVRSVYYDNQDFQCYKAALSGLPTKVKFRTRRYDDSPTHQAQIKFKAGLSVAKLKVDLGDAPSDLPPWSMLGDTRHPMPPLMRAHAAAYGHLTPAVVVTYRRYRYRAFDYRLNVDTEMMVSRPGHVMPTVLSHYRFPFSLLEIKSRHDRIHLPVLGLTHLPQVSFSKFGRGMMMLATNADALSKFR